jgi:hypothetical protein
MSCKRGKVFFLFSFFFLKKKKLCNFEETHADSGILNDMLKTKFSDIIVIVMWDFSSQETWSKFMMIT